MRQLHNLPTSLTVDRSTSPAPSPLLLLPSLLPPHSAYAEIDPTRLEGFFRNFQDEEFPFPTGDSLMLYVDQFSQKILSRCEPSILQGP